ncbi:ankyrin repeat-containing domain protein [Hypoxylon argillaceum]|nr:ankyrin repeat-containing domain protein [Hypoxylon argillaceum]
MSADDWERFKAIILNLYLLEKTTLNEVARYMEQNHQFSKKKSQYEYQFKKWGVKKNAKEKDWKSLRRQLEKRAGKHSEVTLFGIPLSPGRVRKRTQRYTPIPTAREFGKRLGSPECLEKTVVRAQTPIIMENIPWPALPWLQFKNNILHRLRDPSTLLRTLFASLGTEMTVSWYDRPDPSDSLYNIFGNPVHLRRTLFHLTSTIPDDDVKGQMAANNSANDDSSLSISTAVLKSIFFRLSNKMIPPDWDTEGLRAHDQFVLHLVDVVSSTDPETLSRILLDDHCVTSKAIREAVYGSAIRKKHYTIVSRLLGSGGVDLNRVIGAPPTGGGNLERGLLKFRHLLFTDDWSGMLEAASTSDTRLGKILLRAGASLNVNLILEAACSSINNSDASMEFVKFLDDHGIINNYSESCFCPIPGSRLIPSIAISIARSKNHITKFLIERFLMLNEKSISLPQYSPRHQCRCCMRWFSKELREYATGYMSLHLAIVMGNEKIIERLLLPLMSHPLRVSTRTIRKAFHVSCLAGDENTALKLLSRHSEAIISHSQWGMTPLIATAWNTENITIAETLLELGADIEPMQNDGLSMTGRIAPIHVAAFYGNIVLVQQLLFRGADCNAHYTKHSLHETLKLPENCESALQFALEGGETEMARLLMPHSHLLGRELMQAALHDDALISQLISKGARVTWADKFNRNLLDIAAITGNKALNAIEAAVELKDHSIVQLLAGHRNAREIDGIEASSLVFAISKREWDIVSLLLQDSFIPGPAGSRCYLFQDSRGRTGTPLCAALLSDNQSVIELMTKRGYTLYHLDLPLLVDGVDIWQAFWDRFPLETMNVSFHRTLIIHAIESRSIQNVQDVSSRALSPLALATINGDTEIVRVLLKAGADVDFIDPTSSSQGTALQHAARQDHLHLVQLLLDWGARVDPASPLEYGATPLQYSAIQGNLKIAQLLLLRGADINALPAKWNGRTALEGASEHGRLDMVQFLLKMGARIDGQMRIYYVRSVGFAKFHDHLAITAYLMQFGSWGNRDQMLYDKPYVLQSNVHFLYEEKIDDWRSRRMNRRGRDIVSVGSSECSSASSSELDDSVYESEEDELDQSDDGELSSDSYDTDYIPQAEQNNMNLAIAEPSGLDRPDTQTIVYDLASSHFLTTQRVIEIDDTRERVDLVPSDVGFNMASRTPVEPTTNQLELWGPRSSFREELNDFRSSNDMPEICVANELDAILNGVEMTRADPFFGAGQPDERCDELGVVIPSRQEIEREGPSIGVGDADTEWDWLLASFHRFDDTDM